MSTAIERPLPRIVLLPVRRPSTRGRAVSDRREINRRDFLTLPRRALARRLEVSGEQFLMKFLDAKADGTQGELFERLEADLRQVDELHIIGVTWLRHEDISPELGRVLNAFRERGGRVVVE